MARTRRALILGDALYRKEAADLGERRTVVIVDEARSLSLDVLEQLHLVEPRNRRAEAPRGHPDR
jgi:type II secretory pathway predicted ATPase ExeA